MQHNTLIKSYMLWMEHLDDNVKMQLAIALLQSVKLPTIEPKTSTTPRWEGETAEELMETIYSARTSNINNDE